MSQIGKVKSFSLNSKKKKDIEKQKKIAEEEAAAEVYEEFVATFEASKPEAKLFVRGNVINPSSGKEISGQNSGKFYKPNKLQELERQKLQDTKKNEDRKLKTFSPSLNEKPPKKKGDVKKKSNLEMFKEELKMIQEEREERFKLRHQSKDKPALKLTALDDDTDNRKSIGSHDNGDPNTTNIYLGNLNPKLTETQLCEIFGRYGPLASVKIMWPRTDEERTRNRNCGFVAFMCRKDGERAIKAMSGRMVMDYEMRLGWGKAVPIPPNPVYIPPALRELTMPPPISGLPFNAQVVEEEDKKLLAKYGDPQVMFREDKEAFNNLLSRAVVKVVMPIERPLLCLIHRVVEFVVREGPMFEALLMNREAKNPMFTFLFDNQSQAHVYYRWRLFSVLQGDHPSRWRTKEFRMFEGGSIWRPPPIDLYLQGMPEELLPKDDEYKLKNELEPQECFVVSDGKDNRSDEFNKSNRYDLNKKGTLTDSEREELEDMLRSLTPQRSKIGKLMVFCIEHADASEEIIECITDSLCIRDTPLFKKIARLFLVSDILHNCSVKVINVSNYRKGFQSKLVPIFESFNQAYNKIEGRLKAEHFKQRVMNCIRAWQDTAIFASDFLIKLQNIFLGLHVSKDKSPVEIEKEQPKSISEDIDGIPIIDPDLDGVEITDFDKSDSFNKKFKPSKWETVDPDVVESQAITSRWENLEKSSTSLQDDDIDGEPLEGADFLDSLIKSHKESKNYKSVDYTSTLSREVLREIEMKVVKYQDDLESNYRNGRFKLGSNDSIAQMVKSYREDLLRKASTCKTPVRDHKSSLFSSSHSRRSRSRSRSPKSRHSSHHTSKRRSRSKSPNTKRRK